MRLITKNSKNNTYYYAIESFRKGKKTSTRIVKSFGSKSELLKNGIEDPHKYCLEKVNDLNHERKDNKTKCDTHYDFSKPLEVEGDYSKSKAINLGWKVVANIFDDLKLPELFHDNAGKEEYDVSEITKFIVATRMIAPCSKYKILASLENYYDAPVIKDKNAIYRTIEKVDKMSDDIQACVYKNMPNIAPIDTSALIVDCTNTFFETPLADDDVVDENGNVLEKGLRKYGVSKEHRPNPIVQIALFSDINGVPLTYSIDSGNTNEQKMVVPLESKLIRTFDKHSFIYCSDGGLGSFENRFFNTLQNRNYVVTQSLKKTSEDELKLVFNDLNWNTIGHYEMVNGEQKYIDGQSIGLSKFKAICDKKYNGEQLTPEEEELIKKDRIYKKSPMVRSVDVNKFLKIKGTGIIEMPETLFITFSAKYYLYQKSLLDNQLNRAKIFLNKNIDEIKKGPNDVTRFITTTSVTKEGEVCEVKLNDINTAKVEEEKRFHGFYAIATSLDTDILEILKINGNRWRIEEIFRIMKSNFDLRPVFSWKKESINAHVLFIFLATQIYRLMELKLKEKSPDAKVNINTILETLKNINIVETHTEIYKSIYTGSKILNGLVELTSLPLNKECYRKKDLDRLFKK